MTRARSNAFMGAVRAGDIMVKHRHGLKPTGVIIKLGQLFSRGKSDFVHAGVANSGVSIIEQSGGGLFENSLLTTNAAFTYDVFRCQIPGVAAGAAETAVMLRQGVAEGNFALPYTSLGAARSLGPGWSVSSSDRINKTLDQLVGGNSAAFFCSGFVVYCYLVAMEQMNIAVQGSFPLQRMKTVFGIEDRYYNPSFLHQHLMSNANFKFIGKVKGAVLV